MDLKTWLHGRPDRKSLGRPFGKRSYHHYPRYLLNFEHVAEDPEQLKTTIWLELRCGGPVTRKSKKDDNLAWITLRRTRDKKIRTQRRQFDPTFDVARTEFCLWRPKEFWLLLFFLRCGGPVTLVGRNTALGFTDAPLSIYRIENWTNIWSSWAICSELPWRRYVLLLKLKPREKKEIPHVFEEKLTVFSLFFTLHTSAEWSVA